MFEVRNAQTQNLKILYRNLMFFYQLFFYIVYVCIFSLQTGRCYRKKQDELKRKKEFEKKYFFSTYIFLNEEKMPIVGK